MTRYGMVLEKNKCTGCKACVAACANRNGTPSGIHWCSVDVEEIGTSENFKVINTASLCNHCENAPCVGACPTGSSQKDENGIVWVDYSLCIGCKSCMMACPYNKRYYLKELTSYYPNEGPTEQEKRQFSRFVTNVVTKCTFCKDWLEQGLEPACVHTCMYDARHFGDLDDPDSEVSKLIVSSNAHQIIVPGGAIPSVYYID